MAEDTKPRIGFVGLGRMGAGMARNLAKNGADLTVYDHLPAASEALAADGARAATSLAELVAGVDILFTSLPGPAEVEETVFGPDGVLAHMKPGLTLVDLTTSSREMALKVNEAITGAGGRMFDAPVSGGPAGAASGELALWVGGDKAGFDAILPVLKMFSYSQQYMGEVGAGTATKLAHNMLGYTLLASLSEAFTLAVKAGIAPLDFWNALGAGMVGRKPVTHMLVNQFLPNVYDKPAFLQRLALKDITLAVKMAEELEVPVRLSSLTREDMRQTVEERGMSEWDSRAFLQLQLERAGVEIEVDPAEIAAAMAQGK